jgi:hypothetical protein
MQLPRTELVFSLLVAAGLCLPPGLAAASPDPVGESESQKQAQTGPEKSEQDSDSATAGNRKEASVISYPKFQPIRYEEDWGVLKDSLRDNGYEKFKFMPLSESGDAFLSFGGQLRLRGEAWSNFGFGGGGSPDDTYGLSRLRLHGSLHLGTRFRAFVEGKSSLSTDRDLPGGRRTGDVDTIDLQNALLDVNAALEPVGVTFRLGRQELRFGKQRLVSPLDWSNTRRTWDTARAIVKLKGLRVDGFWSRFAPVKKYSFNTSDDSGLELYGIYATGEASSALSLDVYWLGFERDLARFHGLSAPEKRDTIGGRFWGEIAGTGADFDAEAAFQFGNHGLRDVRSSFFAGQVGFPFPNFVTRPRVYAGLDFGSGDDEPEDNKLSTFNPMFPLGHAYLGYVDLVGRQNIVDWNAGLSFFPVEKLKVQADGHNFWRHSDRDALYNPGGGVVRSGASGDSKYVGFEIDFTVSRPVNRNFLIVGGYSHFFSGAFIEESGPSDDIDFGYLMLQFTF